MKKFLTVFTVVFLMSCSATDSTDNGQSASAFAGDYDYVLSAALDPFDSSVGTDFTIAANGGFTIANTLAVPGLDTFVYNKEVAGGAVYLGTRVGQQPSGVDVSIPRYFKLRIEGTKLYSSGPNTTVALAEAEAADELVANKL